MSNPVIEITTVAPASVVEVSIGPRGLQGTQGDTGATGLQGIQGTQGIQGDAGLQGTQGATGATGPTQTNASLLTTGTVDDARLPPTAQAATLAPAVALAAAAKSGALKLASTVIDALDPPSPLVAAVFDGTTNDTVALQAMLDHITATGGTVRVPEGRTGRCNLVITGTKGATLAGGGLGSVLTPYDMTKPVLAIGDGATDTKHVTVENLKFAGDDASATSDGIVLNGVTNVDFSNIAVFAFGGTGVRITSGTQPTQYISIKHMWIDYCTGIGLDIDGGTTWTSALFANGLFIQGRSNAGAKALRMGASTELIVHGGYVQIFGNELGHIEMASTAIIHGQGLFLDSDSSADVIVVITGTKGYVSSCLRGEVSVDGKVKWAIDNTTVSDFVPSSRMIWPSLTSPILTDVSLAKDVQDSSAPGTTMSLVNNNHQLLVYPYGQDNAAERVLSGYGDTPSGTYSPGHIGQVMWDATYVYFCTLGGYWQRVPFGTAW